MADYDLNSIPVLDDIIINAVKNDTPTSHSRQGYQLRHKRKQEHASTPKKDILFDIPKSKKPAPKRLISIEKIVEQVVQQVMPNLEKQVRIAVREALEQSLKKPK